jgi:ubiquinone/menaquinone biosynthesis C-methylase UbiE
MSLSLEKSTEWCALLADASRQRLLLLLEAHELSVAELTGIAGLVQDRRVGAQALYSAAPDGGEAAALWKQLRARLDDAQARLDAERAQQAVASRKHGQSWADSVAGRMELHYSPGRTWEVTARALAGLIELGEVLDIGSGDGVLAELIAAHAQTVTCVDLSPAVVAAARKRLAPHGNVSVQQADMHALPFADRGFDHVFLMHALTYTHEPQQALREAARVLRPRGRLIVATLNAHKHEAAMQAYDHVNLGIAPTRLRRMLEGAGLEVEQCGVSSRESRPPYFAVVTALARRR